MHTCRSYCLPGACVLWGVIQAASPVVGMATGLLDVF